MTERAISKEKKLQQKLTFPLHAHFWALHEAAVLALVVVVLVDGEVPVAPKGV